MVKLLLRLGVLIPLFAIIGLAITGLAANSSGIEVAALEIVDFSPDYANFVSPSTTQGTRRFLAIGNFLDTTNNAYFADSRARLGFSIPKYNRLEKVELILYKYAHGGAEPVDLNLRIAGSNELVSSATAPLGNYDYSEIKFDIPTSQIAQGGSIEVEIDSDDPRYAQGIAVCSGNFTDSVCQQEHFPRLIITHRPNVLGELVSSETTETKFAGNTYSDDYLSCDRDSCRLEVAYNYVDPDNNSRLRLVASGVGQDFYSDWAENLQSSLEIDLGTGLQDISLEVDDGGELLIFALAEIDINLISPEPPIVVYADEIMGRDGIQIYLEQDESAGLDELEYLLGIAEVPGVISKYDTTEIWLDNPGGLTYDGNYHLGLQAKDSYGNLSETTTVSFMHRPNLQRISNVQLSHGKISPANNDGYFDQTSFLGTGMDSGSAYQIRIHDGSYNYLASINGRAFNGKVYDSYLNDGIYYLQLAGRDSAGFDYLPSGFQRVEVDNTPPRVWRI